MTQKFTSFLFHFAHPALEQNILGIHFKNPVGLSAGFDKNAELTDIMPAVGFGFTEVGSITGEACPGNQRPRLWRLPLLEALVVNYGLKNDGAQTIAGRLQTKKFKIPVGISIAKTNDASIKTTEQGIADYGKSYSLFSHIGDYTTINISCPNIGDGLPFFHPSTLARLLAEVKKTHSKKPIFLKLPADSTDAELDAIIEVADMYGIHGFVCSNLTKTREGLKHKDSIPPKGGISGKPTQEKSNHIIQYIFQKTKGKFVIIGVGGIFSAEDAYEKIRLGASLVQLITGMIYQGPQLIGEINQGLVELLQRDGYSHISEAIGKDTVS